MENDNFTDAESKEHTRNMWDYVNAFHNCSVEVDNMGQIVLYTGLMFDENDNVVPWKEKEA